MVTETQISRVLVYARALLIAASPVLALSACQLIGTLLGELIPGIVTSLLLFLPQYVFPYSHYYYVTHQPYTMTHTIGGPSAYCFSLLQWSVAFAIVAAFTKRQTPLKILAFGVAATLIVTIVMHVVISAMGYEFQLDSF
jgi:hypothetical protein